MPSSRVAKKIPTKTHFHRSWKCADLPTAYPMQEHGVLPPWRLCRLLSLYLGLGRAGGFSSDEEGENRIQSSEGSNAPIGSLTEKEKVVLDFHYYNYAFCKERRFDACATSTFLSIMKDILDEVKLAGFE